MKRIAVIGAGNWGTALAVVAARKGHDVAVWSRNIAVVEDVNKSHENSLYLANVPIPQSVVATSDFSEALRNADFVILAAPSHVTRSLLHCKAK
jgi:glycerol-3-phosphate dehydrogenase (NAD(P)+)